MTASGTPSPESSIKLVLPPCCVRSRAEHFSASMFRLRPLRDNQLSTRGVALSTESQKIFSFRNLQRFFKWFSFGSSDLIHSLHSELLPITTSLSPKRILIASPTFAFSCGMSLNLRPQPQCHSPSHRRPMLLRHLTMGSSLQSRVPAALKSIGAHS